jgi:hypothetical protein
MRDCIPEALQVRSSQESRTARPSGIPICLDETVPPEYSLCHSLLKAGNSIFWSVCSLMYYSAYLGGAVEAKGDVHVTSSRISPGNPFPQLCSKDF